MSDNITGKINNSHRIANIETYVVGIRQQMKREYDRSINRDLSRQNSQELLKRNLTAVLQGVYSATLTRLRELSIDVSELDTGEEFTPSALQVLNLFDGIVEELLQYALRKHNTSCALSNFPDEHKPSKTYITQVIEEAAKNWESFAVQVNDVLTTHGTRVAPVS